MYVQHVAKVATGAEIVLITIFVTFVGLPPILHTCVELLNVDPDHQSVYTVVKTNHSSVYCRYRPRDNQEEPRNTPDALRAGNTGENLSCPSK